MNQRRSQSVDPELIHAWVLPGVEDEWGQLGDKWFDHSIDDLCS